MKRFILAMLLAAQCGTAFALELKGVRLGMTSDEFLAAFPPGGTIGNPAEGQSSCYSSGTFCTANVGTLGGVSTTLQVSFMDGKVVHAYTGKLHPPNFEQVVEALKTKFGSPTSSAVGEVQNQIGGKFENPSYVWKFPDGELRAARFMPGMPTLDFSVVEIDSPEWIAKEAAEKAKRNSDL